MYGSLCIEEEGHKMENFETDEAEQLDRNMWAPEEKEETEVVFYTGSVLYTSSVLYWFCSILVLFSVMF